MIGYGKKPSFTTLVWKHPTCIGSGSGLWLLCTAMRTEIITHRQCLIFYATVVTELIPNVGTNILFPVKRDIGISYCRMLLHDTMLKDDSYKTGISSSPICDRGSGESETTEHFLLQCSNYTAARKVMFERIESIGLFSHD